MKKMLEELRNMNNEEDYEVPVSFRKRVISKISKENHKNKAISYIISSLSVAAVAFVAVVIATNQSMYKFEKDTNDEIEYASYGTEDNDDLMFKAIPENSTTMANVEDMAKEKMSVIEDLEKKYLDEIIDMLKINKMDIEVVDEESVKVKAKKEDVELILYYFEGEIDIVQDGEYCIIKEK